MRATRCGSSSASCPRLGGATGPLPPLSAQGVAELAGSVGVDPAELHRRTAGNPFYVTEVLAAADAEIPETVRDAVLARAARLDDRERALLDAVAIAPHARRAVAARGAGRRRARSPSTGAWPRACCAPSATP